MRDAAESIFANPVWHALHTRHRHFKESVGDACRYPADVAPFGAVLASGESALQELHSLMSAGEKLWLFGVNHPPVPGLSCTETLDCLQMVLPSKVAPPPLATPLTQLSVADASAMIALTDLAFPGFFRSRTAEMGAYYGLRVHDELIAMGGERLMLDGYAEISGICTHPAYRGRGFGAAIIGQLLRNHRRDGFASWLHVAAHNAAAIKLYRQLGFEVRRSVTLSHMRRSS